VTIDETGVEGLEDAMAVMLAAFDPGYGEAWNRAQCLGVLAMPGAVLLVARDGDRPVGFALVRVVIDEAELMLLAVTPDARGRGIGRCLLQESMVRAGARGATTYFLEVRSDNPAVKLYSDEGLSCVGYRKDYYLGNDGKRRDAMTFRRSLI
jgi:[ribosomal protein S18]-alanine N-acetyltransferase